MKSRDVQPKPSRRGRIVLVGDSHLTATSSHGVTKLDPRLAAMGWSVTNLAIAGLSTRDATRITWTAPAADWLIFSFGSNDCAAWKEVPLEEFTRNYLRLSELADGMESLFLGPAPVAEAARPNGGRSNGRIHEYSDATASVASKVGGHFLALIDLLRCDGTHHVADGVHLNDVGYEAMAGAVQRVLQANSSRNESGQMTP